MRRNQQTASKAAFRSARRRRVLALFPGATVILWSLADLVAARHARLTRVGAAWPHHIVDHVQPVAWTVLLVLVPYLLALKPKPNRSGAVLALFTGPVLTPILFGSGGWRLWQIGALAALVLWIEGRDQPRMRRREAPVSASRETAAPVEEPPASEETVPLPSFQSISGASFQRRSSS